LSFGVSSIHFVTFSIVIPTRLRPELLARTLSSLECQTEKGFEVIVVCDGEDKQTRSLAQRYEAKFPLFWIFNEENCGAASARNAGAHAARGEILIFLDDDTSAAPDWGFHHRKHYEAQTSDGRIAVCGKIVNAYSEGPVSNTERFLRG
jgi:glycosyltransferase involved in cell wall biosynthesis